MDWVRRWCCDHIGGERSHWTMPEWHLFEHLLLCKDLQENMTYFRRSKGEEGKQGIGACVMHPILASWYSRFLAATNRKQCMPFHIGVAIQVCELFAPISCGVADFCECDWDTYWRFWWWWSDNNAVVADIMDDGADVMTSFQSRRHKLSLPTLLSLSLWHRR